jgi:hypothetical protein
MLNVVQTILILVATFIAVLTFVRTERGRRASLKLYRLEEVEAEIVRLVEAYTLADQVGKEYEPWIRVAEMRLRSAHRRAGLPLGQTELLLRPSLYEGANRDAFDRQSEGALRELAEEIGKLS